MEAHFTKPREDERSEEHSTFERPSQRDYQLKFEMIVLIYRITAMAVGTVLMIVGYLLFVNMANAGGELAQETVGWIRIGPSAAFVVIGLFICLAGFTRWMPLPRYDKSGNQASGSGGQQSEDDIPVLAPLKVSQLNDKVWSKNVKPLMEKVANKEHITSSERDLLRNWLKSH